MGYYVAFPILIIAVLLKASFLPIFFGGIAQPELVLVIVLAWSIHAELEEALFWVFLGGIMQDLMSITPTGTSVIAPLIIVFIIKWLEGNLYQYTTPIQQARNTRRTRRFSLQGIIDAIRNSISAIIILIGFTTLATIFNHLAIVFALNFTDYNIDIVTMLQTFTIPTLAYNLIAILPVYFILRRIQKRLPKPQSAWGVSSQA